MIPVDDNPNDNQNPPPIPANSDNLPADNHIPPAIPVDCHSLPTLPIDRDNSIHVNLTSDK